MAALARRRPMHNRQSKVDVPLNIVNFMQAMYYRDLALTCDVYDGPPDSALLRIRLAEVSPKSLAPYAMATI